MKFTHPNHPLKPHLLKATVGHRIPHTRTTTPTAVTRTMIAATLASTLIGVFGLAPTLQAQAKAASAKHASQLAKRERIRLERLFSAQWRNYAKQYFMYEGKAYLIRNYNPRHPSSLGIDKRRLATHFTVPYRYRSGKMYVTKTKDVPKPDSEVNLAFNVLPHLAAGHYGTIQSVEVDQIDGQEVKVSKLQYQKTTNLGRQKQQMRGRVQRQLRRLPGRVMASAANLTDWMFSYRDKVAKLKSKSIMMRGFDKPPATGRRWQGPFHVVLIKEDDHLIAIPFKQIKPRLSQKQFVHMLERRGKSRIGFAQCIALSLDNHIRSANREGVIRGYIQDFDSRDHGQKHAKRLASASASSSKSSAATRKTAAKKTGDQNSADQGQTSGSTDTASAKATDDNASNTGQSTSTGPELAQADEPQSDQTGHRTDSDDAPTAAQGSTHDHDQAQASKDADSDSGDSGSDADSQASEEEQLPTLASIKKYMKDDKKDSDEDSDKSIFDFGNDE